MPTAKDVSRGKSMAATGAFRIVLIALVAIVTGASQAQAGGPPCAASRDFEAADFSVPVTELRAGADGQALDALKRIGVKTIIRYYEYPTETLACKTLLKDESDAILAKGLSIAVVFQHNNHDPEIFFDKSRGAEDARRALILAEANGQPHGSAIYFSVDGVDQVMKDLVYEFRKSRGRPMSEARRRDLLARGKARHVAHYQGFLRYRNQVFDVPVDRLGPKTILPFVKHYFVEVDRVFRQSAAAHPGRGTFDIGAYGSGLVCDFLLSNRLVKYCWLAQSTGWPDYQAFRATGKWSLSQENPTTCPDWTYQRDVRKVVQLDFNRVSGSQPNFGQWSVKREDTKAIDRPATCPAP